VITLELRFIINPLIDFYTSKLFEDIENIKVLIELISSWIFSGLQPRYLPNSETKVKNLLIDYRYLQRYRGPRKLMDVSYLFREETEIFPDEAYLTRNVIEIIYREDSFKQVFSKSNSCMNVMDIPERLLLNEGVRYELAKLYYNDYLNIFFNNNQNFEIQSIPVFITTSLVFILAEDEKELKKLRKNINIQLEQLGDLPMFYGSYNAFNAVGEFEKFRINVNPIVMLSPFKYEEASYFHMFLSKLLYTVVSMGELYNIMELLKTAAAQLNVIKLGIPAQIRNNIKFLDKKDVFPLYGLYELRKQNRYLNSLRDLLSRLEETLLSFPAFESTEYRIYSEVYGFTIYDTLGDLIKNATLLKNHSRINYEVKDLIKIVINRINEFRESIQGVLEILRDHYSESTRILQLNLVILTLIWMILLQILHVTLIWL